MGKVGGRRLSGPLATVSGASILRRAWTRQCSRFLVDGSRPITTLRTALILQAVEFLFPLPRTWLSHLSKQLAAALYARSCANICHSGYFREGQFPHAGLMGHSAMRHISAVYGSNTHEQGQTAENLALAKDDEEHL